MTILADPEVLAALDLAAKALVRVGIFPPCTGVDGARCFGAEPKRNAPGANRGVSVVPLCVALLKGDVERDPLRRGEDHVRGNSTTEQPA